jgi:cyclic pyranopterin phosphate synthase
MPEEGIDLLSHNDILSYDEIVEVVKESVKHGIDKIRITGGEPLVRKGIVSLISMIWNVEGVKDLSLTTNGILLEKYAEDLKHAGLQRVNISLDTVDPDGFKKITRGGDIEKVFKGIEAAKKVGLSPVKINCVVLKSSGEKDAQMIKKYCLENDLQFRFIHQMNLFTGEFSVVEGGTGGDCGVCNRLRLTAKGMIKPCLFSEIEYSVRELGAEKALELAVDNKPKSGTKNKHNKFHNIGG